jgi:hypothetical protein
VVLKSFNSRKLGLSKLIWHGHFALGVMLTCVLNASIAFVKTNTKKKFITPNLPPLHMATETNSIATRLMTKNFDRSRMNNQNLSITNLVMTKLFQSPFMWWPKTFNHQSYGDRKFFVSNPKFFISNPMATKSFLCQPCGDWIFFWLPYIRQLKAFILDFNCPIDGGLSPPLILQWNFW